MPPVAILENNRSHRKNTLACAVSLAFSTFSSRIMSRIQVWRLVHSGQFSLTTRGPETTRDSAWSGGAVNKKARKVRERRRLFIFPLTSTKAKRQWSGSDAGREAPGGSRGGFPAFVKTTPGRRCDLSRHAFFPLC